MAATLGFAGCGDDNHKSGGTDAAAHKQAVTIKTKLDFSKGQNVASGEVQDGSVIGDKAFCVGTRFTDKSRGDSLSRTLKCSNGTLSITFTPGLPNKDGSQSGPWTIVKGTGEFEGFTGGGHMTVQTEGKDKDQETFTGSVSGQ
jgi:hypothetical protein